MSANRETCFVIMPFSKTTKGHTKNYWTEHFKSFLKPLIEEHRDFEARRSKPLRGDILRQIITDLVVCRVVVADLTDHNPNVYWELGVRQSFKHGVVTVAEAGTRLPFDISAKGTLFYYPKDHLKMPDFSSDFKEAIQDCLINPDRPDSHVLETLSGRGTLFEIFRRDEAMRRLDGLLSECDRNLKTMNKVVKIAQENQGRDLGERNFATERLGVSAVQLLTTNRYIDEGPSFFEPAEEYLMWLNTMNEQLNVWPLYTDSVQEWLMENAKQGQKLTKELRTQVKAARQTLSKRF